MEAAVMTNLKTYLKINNMVLNDSKMPNSAKNAKKIWAAAENWKILEKKHDLKLPNLARNAKK